MPEGSPRGVHAPPGYESLPSSHFDGLAEDPSRFSIACRQIGPIAIDLATLIDGEEVYSARTSIFFKRTHVYRVLDKKRNTLVYLAISDKLIEGSPQNAISTVPVMPWGTSR